MTSHEEPQEFSIYRDRDRDPLAVMSMLSLLTILVVFGVSGMSLDSKSRVYMMHRVLQRVRNVPVIFPLAVVVSSLHCDVFGATIQ